MNIDETDVDLVNKFEKKGNNEDKDGGNKSAAAISLMEWSCNTTASSW